MTDSPSVTPSSATAQSNGWWQSTKNAWAGISFGLRVRQGIHAPVAKESEQQGHLGEHGVEHITRDAGTRPRREAPDPSPDQPLIPGAGNIDQLPNVSHSLVTTEADVERWEGTRETMVSTVGRVTAVVGEFGSYCYQEMFEESEVFQMILQGLKWVVVESSALLHRAIKRVPDLKNAPDVRYNRLSDAELANDEPPAVEQPRSPLDLSAVGDELSAHLTAELNHAFLSSGDDLERIASCLQSIEALVTDENAELEAYVEELRGLVSRGESLQDLRTELTEVLRGLTLRDESGRSAFGLHCETIDQLFVELEELCNVQKRLASLFESGLKEVRAKLERDPTLGPLLPDLLLGVKDEAMRLTSVAFERINAASVKRCRETALLTGANYLTECCSILGRDNRPATRGELFGALQRKQLEVDARRDQRLASGQSVPRYERYLSPGILLSGSEEEPKQEEKRRHEVQFLTGLFLDVIEGVAQERRQSFQLPDFVYRAVAEQMAMAASEMLDQLADQKRIDLAFYQVTHLIQGTIGKDTTLAAKVQEMTPLSKLAGEVVKGAWNWFVGVQEEAPEFKFVSQEEAQSIVTLARAATLSVLSLPENVRGTIEHINLSDGRAPELIGQVIDEKMENYFAFNDRGEQVLKTESFSKLVGLVLTHVLEVSRKEGVEESVVFPPNCNSPEEEMDFFFTRPQTPGQGEWAWWACWPEIEEHFGGYSALKKLRTSLREQPDLFRNVALIELEAMVHELFPPRERQSLIGDPKQLPRAYIQPESASLTSTQSSESEEEVDDASMQRGALKVVKTVMEMGDFLSEESNASPVKAAVMGGVRGVLEEVGDPLELSRLLRERERRSEVSIRSTRLPLVERQGLDRDRAYYADLCREYFGPLLEGTLGISARAARKLGQTDSLEELYTSLGRVVVNIRESLLEQMPLSQDIADAAELEAIEIVRLALQRFGGESARALREESIVRLSQFMKIVIDLQSQLTQKERESAVERQQVILQHLRHEGLLSPAIAIRVDEVGQRKKEQEHYAGLLQDFIEEIAAQRGYKVPGFVAQSGSRMIANHLSQALDFAGDKETIDFVLGHVVEQIETRFEGQTFTGFALQQLRQGISDVLRGESDRHSQARPVLSEREADAIVDVLGSLLAVSAKAPVASSLVRHSRRSITETSNLAFDELLPSLSTVARMVADGTLERVPVNLDAFFSEVMPAETSAPCWTGLESIAGLYSALRELRSFYIENPRVARAALCTALDGVMAAWNEANDAHVV